MRSQPSSAEATSTPEPLWTRSWVFQGLATPKGVIVARKSKPRRLPVQSRVLLVGDERAAAIGQFLGKLALDHLVNFRFEWERQLVFERWYRPEKAEKIAASKANLLLLAMDSQGPKDSFAQKLRDLKRLIGPVDLRWVLSTDPKRNELLRASLQELDVEAFDPSRLKLHASQTGAPSARSYAGLAGALWNVIK